jgi:hypothetical protein
MKKTTLKTAENKFKFTTDGDIIIDEDDDLDNVINIIIGNWKYRALETGIGRSFSPKFIGDAMFSGFYVTSHLFSHDIFLCSTVVGFSPVLNLWKKQTVLFFNDLHESKSISRITGNYELKINSDFVHVLDNIIERHGSDWITPPFQEALKELRNCQKIT